MSDSFDTAFITKILANVFGVEATNAATNIEELKFTGTLVVYSNQHPVIDVIGPDGAWVFTVEFAQDESGDIEAYGAGEVQAQNVVDKIAEANHILGGFLVEGIRRFVMTPEYDSEDRAFNGELANQIEAASKRIEAAGTQA